MTLALQDFPALPSFLPYCFGEKEAYEKAVSAMEPPIGELQTLSIEAAHSPAALYALNGNQVGTVLFNLFNI